MTAAPAPRRPAWPLLLVLTLLIGGLNIFKPLHIDDTAYYYFARQLAAHPLDPYGFSLYWYQAPSHALEVLAPPVVPYTWALGLRLFGDRPELCKLLLLPYVFPLVYAVYSLARRFSAGLETPLTIVTILSPALWPSTNFMLDIPALGLALTAIVLFLHACDKESFFKAACAGLIAGVGFETKYTACVSVAVMMLAAILRGRWLLGFAAVLMATHVFLAWEFIIALISGRSHFFVHFLSGGAGDQSLLDTIQGWANAKGPLVTSLLSLLGGLTLPLLLLGLMALGARRGWLIFITALFLGSIVAIGLLDSHFEGRITPTARFFPVQQTPQLHFELADVLFAVFGGSVLLLAGIVAWSLFRSSSGAARRDVLLLIGWLVLELAAFFPLTPFPAVRRVLGIFIVLSLLFGRYAALHYSASTQRRTLFAIVAFGVLFGVALFTLDFHGAAVQRDGATQAAEWIRQHGSGRAWYAGHWGFQYYAEHNGMMAVIPAYEQDPGLPPPTTLERGDWLVLPDDSIDQQTFQLNPDVVREVARLTFDDPIPLRTVHTFYCSPVMFQHREGPRLEVRIFQVQKDFVPQP